MKPDAITTKPKNRLLLGYLTGFLLSLILTGAAYIAVTEQLIPSSEVGSFVVKLAIIQIAVQLLFFLHLGQESRPRWKLTVFFLMLVVLVILVFGSLWIMENLNYNMMPEQMDQHIIEDEGAHH
jgi:cytochrome o ubiquinol oxidase operon protein cyoD